MNLPDTAKWSARLDQYKPWLPHAERGRWQPFWGPPPDTSGSPNPLIPAELLRAWKARRDEAMARIDA